MTVSSVATTTTPLASVNNFSSSGSIADIANQFSSLVANFSTAASKSPNPQPASGATVPASSDTSAAAPLGGSQGSYFPTGVAAFLFVQTTTSTSAQTTQPPLFASTDTSGNGLVDRREFENKFGNGNQDSASQLFDVLDKNGDNSIDGTELASSKNSTSTTNSSPPASSSDIMWSPSSLFQTLPGMQSASIPGSPNLPLFTRLDADQNGLLNPPEFGAAFGFNAPPATSSFANVDGNGNGSIDWSELNNAQLSLSSSAESSGNTTTTTTFFAELIQLQAAQSSMGTGTTPAAGPDTTSGSSASAATGSSAGSDGSSTDAGSDVTSDSAASTATGSSSSAGSTSSSTTTGDSTSTTASDTAIADPSATLADALTSGATTSQTNTSQTIANLQSGLLDALNPTDGSATSGNNTSSKG